MKKVYSSVWLSVGFSVVIICLAGVKSWGQNTGDYRSNATSFDWSTANAWQVYDGTNWTTAGSKPGASNNVFIQIGHTVTLSENESCRDINLNNTPGETRLALGIYALNVNGKLRAYTGPAGSIPGTSDNPTSSVAWITSTTGKISIAGNTRVLTFPGEWGATNAGTMSPSGFDFELNLNPNQTVTAYTGIKARKFDIVTGTLQVWGGRLAPDQGSEPNSDFIIRNGATVTSNATGTGTLTVIGRTTSGSGGFLDIQSGGTLILRGALPRVAMTTIAFNGTVQYDTIINQTLLQATNSGAPPDTYTNLALSGSGTKSVPMGLPVSVKGSLSITGAASLVTRGIFTLKSTFSNTARVAPITTSAATPVVGNVTVERFIGIPSAKRAWRLLTAPLRSTGSNVSIYDTWQLGGLTGAAATGKGTLITGPNADPATNGLDATSFGFSLKSFNGTDLIGVENTKTTPLFIAAPSAANKSYFLFVRGDRSSTNLAYVSQTMLSAAGALQTGDQTFSTNTTAEKFTLIGNPYASPVDFDIFRQNNSTSNIKPMFYFWDPNLNTVGGYVTVTYDGSGSNYSFTPASNPATGITYSRDIQSGQAIFLTTNTTGSGTPSVTFKETQKSANTVNQVFRTGDQLEKLAINLNLQNTDGTWLLADGILAKYNNIYSTNAGDEDAQKLMNIDENLGILRSGKTLSVEGRPLIDNNDTIFLSMANIKSNRTYQFEFSPNSFNAPGLTATLEDAYLKTSTPVSLSDVTKVNFSITGDTASASANRFRVVFKGSATLPVNFTTVKAYQKDNNIAVEWDMATEANIAKYEVEKSTNGQLFTKAADINARGNNGLASYNWLDVNSVTGNNFYRIKAIENSGNVKYSGIVNVRIGKARGIVVYPNPVKNKTITLQLNDQVKGTYTIQLFNTTGQTVYTNRIVYMGGTATQTLKLNSNIAKGNYTIEVTGAETTATQRIVID